MNKINSSVGSYIGSGTLYGTDRKALRYGIKEQRRQERNERKNKKHELKIANKAEKAKNDRLWKQKKLQLYNYAHSLDFYEYADLHLSNTRKYHTHKDVLKYQNKLRNREYKRLVRLNKKFF